MKAFSLILLISGLAANASSQIPLLDTANVDSLLAKPETDTIVVGGKDTVAVPAVTGTPISGKKSNLRSPTGALLRSLAVPGWGQIYNRKYFKAVLVAGGQGALLGTAVVEWKRASDARKDLDLEGYRVHINNRNLFLWLYAAATVVSILDAYVDAHLSQDTGEGVPQIGHIFLEPDAEKQALLVKIRMEF